MVKITKKLLDQIGIQMLRMAPTKEKIKRHKAKVVSLYEYI